MSATKFIHVSNFEQQQHYKFRNPPWIKLHKKQFKSREFLALSLECQAIFTHLQILASEFSNQIPLEPEWLKRKLGTTRRLNLQPLLKAKLITISNGDGPIGNPGELWNYVTSYYMKYRTDFGWLYDAPPMDARIEKAVVSIGGWGRIGYMVEHPKDAAFARREFIDYFKAKGK